MLESYVLNSTATNHELGACAAHYVALAAPKYEDIAGKGAKQLAFDQIDVASATTFAGAKADLVLRLHRELAERLGALPDLARVYSDIEMPLLLVLERMERAGVMVDAQRLRQQSQELATSIASTEQRRLRRGRQARSTSARRSSCRRSCTTSCICRCSARRRTVSRRRPRTCSSSLRSRYDLPRLVLEYRALAKLKSTYTDKLPAEIDRAHGPRPHVYHQAVAATGRLSSSDPNLQNIPIRTRRRAAHPPGVRRAARHEAHRGRLFADRAADHGAPVGRRGLARCFRDGDGHPSRDGRRGFRRRRSNQVIDRSAPLGEGDQLRPDLRHVARSGSRSSSASSAAKRRPTSTSTSSAIPA